MGNLFSLKLSCSVQLGSSPEYDWGKSFLLHQHVFSSVSSAPLFFFLISYLLSTFIRAHKLSRAKKVQDDVLETNLVPSHLISNYDHRRNLCFYITAFFGSLPRSRAVCLDSLRKLLLQFLFPILHHCSSSFQS